MELAINAKSNAPVGLTPQWIPATSKPFTGIAADEGPENACSFSDIVFSNVILVYMPPILKAPLSRNCKSRSERLSTTTWLTAPGQAGSRHRGAALSAESPLLSFPSGYPGMPTCFPDRSKGGGGQCRPRWPESSRFLTGCHSLSGRPTSSPSCRHSSSLP